MGGGVPCPRTLSQRFAAKIDRECTDAASPGPRRGWNARTPPTEATSSPTQQKQPMRGRSRLVAAWTALALAPAGVAVGAAPAPISGTLSAPRYTVLAVTASGTATTARVNGYRFTIRPPSSRVTLHLRAEDGIYAGPIVVGRQQSGSRAVVGVRAGTKLGRIRVFPRQGYARPIRMPAKGRVDATRWARARNGVPIGAATFGLVRSLRARPRGRPGSRWDPQPARRR
jgi:hypothetical protein